MEMPGRTHETPDMFNPSQNGNIQENLQEIMQKEIKTDFVASSCREYNVKYPQNICLDSAGEVEVKLPDQAGQKDAGELEVKLTDQAGQQDAGELEVKLPDQNGQEEAEELEANLHDQNGQEDAECDTHDSSCQTEESFRETDENLDEDLHRVVGKYESCFDLERISSIKYIGELPSCPPSKQVTIIPGGGRKKQVMISPEDTQKKCSLCKMTVSDMKNLPCGHALCVPCCRLCSGDLRSYRCSFCTTRSIVNHTSQQVTQETKSAVSDSRGLAKNTHTGYCSSHEGQPVRFYCADCCLAVCISCADHSHASHVICRLEQSLELQRNALSSLQHSLMTKIDRHRQQMSLVCDLLSRLHANWTDQSQRVHQACDYLAQAIQSRRCQLLADLQRCYVDKTDRFKKEMEMLQATLLELEACQNFVDHTLQADDSTQMVLLSRQVAMRVHEDQEAPPPPCCYQADDLYFRFSEGNLSDLNTCVHQFGRVSDKQEVAVNATVARNQTQLPSELGREEGLGMCSGSVSSFQSECLVDNFKSQDIDGSTHRLEDIDGRTHQSEDIDGSTHRLDIDGSTHRLENIDGCTHRLKYIESSSVPRASSPFRSHPNPVERRVTRNLVSGRLPPSKLPLPPRRSTIASPSALSVDGRSSRASRLSYASTRSSRTSSGRSGLSDGSLALAGLNSVGGMSPLSTPATPTNCCFFVEEDDLVRTIGTRGRGKGQFSNPQGIAYSSSNDRILVADSNNQCVQIFSLEGSCRLRFGVRGRRPGQMQRPCGVAATPEGRYVVTDYEARCVNLHDQTGNFVKRFGMGKLQGPKGVAVDWRGCLLVVDNRGCCVVTFSAGGRLVSRFGCRGSGQHQLAGPHFVAVDSHSRIVVTDFHNHAVKVFSSEGRFLLSFGGHGEEDGCFNAPTGVAVDGRDNILVADWGNSRIQVFDSQGRYLCRVNSAASSLYGPQDLCMSPEGHVMVADSGNHAIKLYSYNTVE